MSWQPTTVMGVKKPVLYLQSCSRTIPCCAHRSQLFLSNCPKENKNAAMGEPVDFVSQLDVGAQEVSGAASEGYLVYNVFFEVSGGAIHFRK